MTFTSSKVTILPTKCWNQAEETCPSTGNACGMPTQPAVMAKKASTTRAGSFGLGFMGGAADSCALTEEHQCDLSGGVVNAVSKAARARVMIRANARH